MVGKTADGGSESGAVIVVVAITGIACSVSELATRFEFAPTGVGGASLSTLAMELLQPEIKKSNPPARQATTLNDKEYIFKFVNNWDQVQVLPPIDNQSKYSTGVLRGQNGWRGRAQRFDLPDDDTIMSLHCYQQQSERLSK
jgi:hypothetical protein